MRYDEIEPFLKGIEQENYHFIFGIYTEYVDMMFYTDGERTIVLENRGRVLGFEIFHNSTLKTYREEIRRIRLHHPPYLKLL